MHRLVAAFLYGLAVLPPCTESEQAHLSVEQRREVVEGAATAYADGYVFEDKGRLIAEGLRQQNAAGAFDRYADAPAFAAALTEAARRIQPIATSRLSRRQRHARRRLRRRRQGRNSLAGLSAYVGATTISCE